MEDEALGRRAAGEAVDVLGFLGRPEGGDGDVLGVAALEHGAEPWTRGSTPTSADAGEGTSHRGRRSERPREDGLTVGFVLEIFEDDVEVDVGELAFAEFGE